MDRKVPRGAKSKNAPPPGGFITLGKSSVSRPDISVEKPHSVAGFSGTSERSRDNNSTGQSRPNILPKRHGKAIGDNNVGAVKPRSGLPSGGSDTSTVINEEWENVAEEFEPCELITLIEAAEEIRDYDHTEAYLCGAIKQLKAHRNKPDNLVCLSLMYLAKVKPYFLNKSDLVIEALCSILRRDNSVPFKTKPNSQVSVLSANILMMVYQDEKYWPDLFVRLFIEDSLSDRIWVDSEECKGFVDNIVTAFKTKLPPRNLLFHDLGVGNRSECPSPPVLGASSSGDSMDCDTDISLECKETMDINVINRYSNAMNEIKEIVLDAIQKQLSSRHQNLDSVAKGFIRFLSCVCGLIEVRMIVAQRMEMWLQSPKLLRPATELLMSLCLNCNTHSKQDIECISQILKLRLKHKPVISHYMTCLKELLSAHLDNAATVLKLVIHNELSKSKNPSNISIIAVVFQFAPKHAAEILADTFLELLCNTEDYLKALRLQLREIVRGLRHDMQYRAFCLALMSDVICKSFLDEFEHKERVFHSIADLITLTLFVSISPHLREHVSLMFRGEPKDPEVVYRHQEMIACIQADAVHWFNTVAVRCYSPSREEYIRSLHKILLMEQQADSYYCKDNWPVESDRLLYFKLTAEAPLKQETLLGLLMIANTKDYCKPQEMIELIDKLVQRAASLHFEGVELLCIDDLGVIEHIFNLCPYIPPENSILPSGYRPPKMAIANLYWKAWIILLLITAHNPGIFGELAWKSYPCLKALMEMCITNSFVFPPPTFPDREEVLASHSRICAIEYQQILEFEYHLAQKMITEQTSILLSHLITMDPTGPARKPPVTVLEQLKVLNSTHRIGHLLCRCRNPDFLLDIIQRQGASQTMPWLADLVQEDTFSLLPVQCLCEFLLSETLSVRCSDNDSPIVAKHHQLLKHLRGLLRMQPQDDLSSGEILKYFFRRLSSPQASSRIQAIKGLQLVVLPNIDSLDIDSESNDQHIWLQHLPKLPYFGWVQSAACDALREACQIETDPSAVSAYIHFLAEHTRKDSLHDKGGLVRDMAQLIVERLTMMLAILPSPERISHPFPNSHSTLKAFFHIFLSYMRDVRACPKESYSWPESQENVRIQWATGEQAVMNIYVVHAMVILLTFGPNSSPELFHELLNIWFPKDQEMPVAYLVDSPEEVLLLPDWLQLKMLKSSVSELVDAALKDLEPSQLVLFVQSFGIPVTNMTKLLSALDIAVQNSEEAVAAAVLDRSHKAYMAQLVEVQHKRGAKGGHAFAGTLGDRDESETSSDKSPPFRSLVSSLKDIMQTPIKLPIGEVHSFVHQCFTNPAFHHKHKVQVRDTMRVLQHNISKDIHSGKAEKLYLSHLLRSFNANLCSQNAVAFVEGLHRHYCYSASIFRVLLSLKNYPDCETFYALTYQIVTKIICFSANLSSPLSSILTAFMPPVVSSSALSKIGSAKLHEESCDVSSEQVVLNQLIHVPPSQLEKKIRMLVQTAMKKDKVNCVILALTRILASQLHIKPELSAEMSSVPLLMDWIQVLDPELCLAPQEFKQLFLFGKKALYSGKSKHGSSYILAAFTHQARWSVLESTVRMLLSSHSFNLHPSSVLEFIWAVLHVPKLWQGRERRLPRHTIPDILLTFNAEEIVNLSKYILDECKIEIEGTSSYTSLHSRMPLLLYCVHNATEALNELINYLLKVMHDFPNSVDSITAGYLFYQLYLQKPYIGKYLSNNFLARLAEHLGDFAKHGHSSADVPLHTLLTMLTTPQHGKEFRQRMHDFDACLRKLSSLYPLLVLRHLPLLASSLHGVSHLHFSILRYKNYLELFSIVMGILELLQPYLFLEKYQGAFCNILDAYMELMQEQGHSPEMGSLLQRVCHLMQAWVSSQGNSASFYLSSHSTLLKNLKEHHTNIVTLRSLAAVAVSGCLDQAKQEVTSKEVSIQNAILFGGIRDPPLPHMLLMQAFDLKSSLDFATLPDNQLDLLNKVADLTDHSYDALLPTFIHSFCEGLLSHTKEVRKISWKLLARLLHFRPIFSHQVTASVLAALQDDDTAVAETAMKHLSDVILILHDKAPDLLCAAFASNVISSQNTASYLSKALLLLTVSTGA